MAVASSVVVALTGLGWWTAHHVLGGITISHALGIDGPRSSLGAMNILLIGLDSRKDQHGNDLPADVLEQLHAGGTDDGGYNTNTLILAHVGADNRVSAFSIPRDDYVTADGIPGYDYIKIKQAYGLAKAATEQTLVDQGIGDQQTLETQGREAGRAATLTAVRDLTGVPIDYFAEVNLAGFYDLAATLGSIQVCLNHSVYDDYSGADFPAGRQTLNAAQALAFVRQRHGLDNGDLDRTHRQQAFLVSVMHQLQDAGTFSDLTKLDAILTVARKDVVLSAGWGLEQFRRIGAIAGGDVRYQTLPVVRYDTVDGQDVNIIDPAAIQAEVTAAFTDGDTARRAAPPAPSSTVDVLNAGDTPGLAGTVSQGLSHRGYPTGEVRNPGAGEPSSTTIDYAPGADADADTVASLLAIKAAPHADPALTAGHVRIVLGPDYVLPGTFAQPDPGSSTAQPITGPATETTTPMDIPDHGQPVTGNAIPCVD